MRLFTGILFIGLAGLAGPLLAADVDSRIDGVTIYPGRMAEIERLADTDLNAGQGELVFSNLPSAIVDGSVRVAVTQGDVIIGGVEVAREPVGEPPRERERKLRAQLEQLKYRHEDAMDRVAAAKNEITFIEGLAQLPTGEKAAEALTSEDGAANWQSLWERIGSGSREARQRMRTAEREAMDIKDEVITVEEKLQQLGRSQQQSVRVTVPYRSSEAGNAELKLTYRVRGPSWQPRYEARLDTEAGQVMLVRTARVNQATGEDWTDVNLALSTSQPVYGKRPELSPWWIDFAAEVKPMRQTESARVMQESMTADAVGAAAAPAPSETVNAEFAATYVISGRVNVPAGNEPRELPIGSHELKAEIGAETMPQTDPRAWLVADTTWNGEGPLPSGSVSRFRDGAYIGEGRLDSWAPDEERTLAFGTDPSIEVSFKPTKDEAGKSGWITSSSTLARYYRLEITNHHDRSLPVTALIRMPVAKNEDISIDTDFSTEPSEKDVDDDQGIYAWKFDLGASQSDLVELGYRISYPEDKELSGI